MQRDLRTLLFVGCLLLGHAGARGQDQAAPPAALTPPPPGVVVIPQEIVFPPEKLSPLPPPPPKTWWVGVELGVNGTDGNSETFKVRSAVNAKNETPTYLWLIDAWYAYATANAVEAENQGQLSSRYEWKLGASPWSTFASGQLNQNRFTAYDYRLAGHGGFAYNFVKSPAALCKGRFGAGGSREFGGPNDDFMPEALLGLDTEYKVSALTKFCFNGDLFPDLGDLGEFRAECRAACEVLVDPELNLTLKAGAIDRYDSTPEGRKPNDVEYFLVLLWKY